MKWAIGSIVEPSLNTESLWYAEYSIYFGVIEWILYFYEQLANAFVLGECLW